MGKSDAIAGEIVSALRGAGCTVRFIIGEYGQAGIPDLLVGFRGQTHLMEVKVKGGRLSKAQKDFRATWVGGPLWTVHNIPEAFAAIAVEIEAGRIL